MTRLALAPHNHRRHDHEADQTGCDGGARRRAGARARGMWLEQLELAPSAAAASRRPKTQPQSGGKRGGTLTVLNHEDFENIDPGHRVLLDRLRGRVRDAAAAVLLQAEHVHRAQPGHGLRTRAKSPPTARRSRSTSATASTFSPPVNREVTSADVAYAIERGANPNVANPYFEIYFSSLEGCRKRQGRPVPGHHHARQVHDRLPPEQAERGRSSSTRSCCR